MPIYTTRLSLLLEYVDTLDVAQAKFDKISNSPSIDIACDKIKSLAKAKELDSSLILLINAAWASAKESKTMKNEVKKIMFRIYKATKNSLRTIAPKEIKLLEHLRNITDHEDRFSALAEAFSPYGHESKDPDALYTHVDTAVIRELCNSNLTGHNRLANHLTGENISQMKQRNTGTLDKTSEKSILSTSRDVQGIPKPTNPKPFRLRTDERGILKEANMEKRLHLLNENDFTQRNEKGQMKSGNETDEGSETQVKKITRKKHVYLLLI